MKTLLFTLALATPCLAQPNLLRRSEAIFIAGAAADIATSWGLEERNPILGRGTFGPRQAVTSAAISAGVVVAAELVGKKWPRMQRVVGVVLVVAGGVRGGVAVQNIRERNR